VINETVVNISRGATEFIEAVRVTNLSRYLEALKERGVSATVLMNEAPPRSGRST
jgi:tRNA G18 (ribose-2'-O)-methylase SpoU